MAPVKAADQVVALAQKLQCTLKAERGQTDREVRALKTTPVKPTAQPVAPPAPPPLEQPEALIVPGRPGEASRQTPGLLLSGNGELQIAVSNDGHNIVIGTNSGNEVSTDGGVSFKAVPGISWGFGVDGDPSVGVGWTGSFYFATIGFPASGCTNSVARSTDGGQTFNFSGNAVLCPAAGKNMCFPDQEQMAVDRFNEAGGSDELYMVWRNFPAQNGVTNCSLMGPGNPTPTISCSEDSGKSWVNQTLVGTGDRGRVTVGKDGFVYVTYVAGSNLMINKFSPCSQGLKQQSNFPVTVTSMKGVNCPIAGLDRCDATSGASPQPAVDDANPKHVFVAYADNTASDNENIVLRESLDGGLTWPVSATMNTSAKARRFMPWVCVTQGITYVTWYDRRAATQSSPDLTAYFLNTAKQNGISLTTGKEINASKANDPQCASGWPCSADNNNDANFCPVGSPALTGNCLNGAGTGSNNVCTVSAPVCPRERAACLGAAVRSMAITMATRASKVVLT